MKNLRVKGKILVILVFVFCITGCIPWKSESDVKCRIPSVKVAYPYQVLRGAGDAFPIEEPLSQEWEPQFSDEQIEKFRIFSANTMIARYGDIWFTHGNGLLARYQPAEHKLVTYTVSYGGEFFSPQQLFLTSQGILWGVDHLNHESLKSADFLLSRYDPQADRFEPIFDREKILPGEKGFTSITADKQGKLWLGIDGVLYTFDPVTNHAEEILDEGQGYSFESPVVASDDTIWLAGIPITKTNEAPLGRIFHYDPGAKNLEYHGLPPDTDRSRYFAGLYVDKSDRVWVSNYGWLELGTGGRWEWYKIFETSVFISQGEGEFSYTQSRPSTVYESSNGLFWFISSAGLVRLDLEEGEWCLLTTVEGKIAEDDSQNLWFFGDRQLYKYHLEP